MTIAKHSGFSHTCPACQGVLVHGWLRPVDKFLKLFVPVRRYRCSAEVCRWEGNIATQNTPPMPLSPASQSHDGLTRGAKAETPV